MLPFDSIRINRTPSWFHCEPTWHWAPPPLADFDLWFVASGRGEMSLGGESTPLHSGVAFILCPGDRPFATQHENNRLVVFACHFSPLSVRASVRYPNSMQVRDAAFFMASANRAEKLWRRGDEFACQQAQFCIENMLRQLWDEVQQAPLSPLDVSFEHLAERIRREPGEKWALDAMAGSVHLSRSQFVRRFRLLFGRSPTHFVIQIRLERAQQLLQETNLSLDQIAYALGYSDIPFFTRQFKQFCGQTPSQFRKNGLLINQCSVR